MQIRAATSPWSVAALLVASLVALPLAVVVSGLFGEPSDTWSHLASTVLASYVLNSLVLLVGVGALTLVIGVTTAWCVATLDFPGRRILEWALVLPLALPTYIIAVTYAGVLDYYGPLQQTLVAVWPGASGLYLRSLVMSLPGAVVILALVLYPYVYLVSRASFAAQTTGVIETARMLGRGPWETFFQVALPLARPAVAAGLALVLMEVLNEYGAVRYFGIPTFTTGIFRAWFPLGDPDAAMRLAAVLLSLVAIVAVLERVQRGRARFHEGARARGRVARRWVGGVRGWIVAGLCALPVVVGFVVPVGQLVVWAGRSVAWTRDPAFLRLVVNSFGLAFSAAVLTILVALVVAYAARLSPTPLLRAASRVASMGYAVPGAVIAVGLFPPLLWIDRRVGPLWASVTGAGPRLLLTGTVAALILAYGLRFLAVALGPIRSGFSRVCGSLDETARSLGSPPLRTLWRVDLPLLRGTLVGAAMLVFVDVLKELPLTLILRPFNFDTLATHAYQLAIDERVSASAAPALLIVLTGLVPVILLNRFMRGEGEVTEP